MTSNVAYIVDKLCSITKHPPVKKALQKTIFLLQEKGVDFGFEYILHFYGPYCAELDQETMRLSSEGVIHFDYGRYGHKMSVSPEYQSTLAPELSEQSLQVVQELIERYQNKGPSDLELLTTAIYAYKHIGAKTPAEVVTNVKKIKGEKYDDNEIAWALSEFPYFGIAL